MGLCYVLYQALIRIGLATCWPLLAIWGLKDFRYRTGWGERLGYWNPLRGSIDRDLVLIHGAGVGEVRSTTGLVRALRARGSRVLVTSTCPYGKDAGAAIAGEDGGDHDVHRREERVVPGRQVQNDAERRLHDAPLEAGFGARDDVGE